MVARINTNTTNNTKGAKDTRTLDQALDETIRDRWEGTRSCGTHRSGSEIIIRDLTALHKGPNPMRICDVTPAMLQTVVRKQTVAGIAASTIIKRLNHLSVMGVNVQGTYPRAPKLLKWWLRPDVHLVLSEWLKNHEDKHLRTLHWYLLWASQTGCRVEESLRLRRSDFAGDYLSVTVPGTKTKGSQATLPITKEAAEVVASIFGPVGTIISPSTPLFDISYVDISEAWRKARTFIGADEHGRMATLKAVRRTAARRLHADLNMPLDKVRHYLRHSNVKTTMGYLQLTGGYSDEELRRYF